MPSHTQHRGRRGAVQPLVCLYPGTATTGVCVLSYGPGVTTNHRDPVQGAGSLWRGLALQQEGSFQWAETPESQARSGLQSLLLPPTVKQRIRVLQCPKDSDRTEGAGAGNHPHPQQPSNHCQGAALWSGHQGWSAPAPSAAGSGGVAGDKDA